MSDFKTATPPAKMPDATKRVNYTLGMVLGVDEFQQEQAYFLGKHRLHHRLLHGYGTVSGLRIHKRDGANGVEIRVEPGRAVDPYGRDICVSPTQCARLNEWLAANRDMLGLGDNEIENGFDARLYVALCYRECETDSVPIPGAPCRSQQDSMAASRIADDFELKIMVEKPAQLEEEVIREFGALLAHIEISHEAPVYLSRDELLEHIRALGQVATSPPLSPEPESSPPLPGDTLYLDPATACDDLRAAFLVWVTEVRPALLGAKASCNGHAMADACMLIAALDFHVNPGLVVDFDSLLIDEEERPYLLPTRLLQEWLLCGRLGQHSDYGENLFATAFAIASNTFRLWIHHPAPVSLSRDAVSIHIDEANRVMQRVDQAPGTNVFDLTFRERIGTRSFAMQTQQRFDIVLDLTKVIERDSGMPLSDVISQAGYDYVNRHEQTIVVTGAVSLPFLAHLLDVDTSGGTDGQVLTLQGDKWVPSDAGTGVTDHSALTNLDKDDHPHYLLANGDRPLGGNLSAGGNKVTDLAAATDTGEAVPFEQAVKRGDAAAGDLAGNYPNPTVTALQGNAVATTTPQNGHVLTWSASARRWQPQTPATGGGEFVMAPAGTYAIVAAGIFQVNGNPQGPTYNELKAAPIDPRQGDYLLIFRGYRLPREGRPTYIVKGTVQDFPQPQAPRATFQFVQFQDDGIRVRILDIRNRPNEFGFMVEISAY